MIYNGEEVYGVIYTVTHLASGKKYVGQSTDLKKRFRRYRNLDCDHQPKLLNALRKYGIDAFEFEVVYIAYDKEQLDFLEIWHINTFNTINFGYNCKTGGANGKHNAETRAKLSAAGLKRKLSQTSREKIRIANLGSKRSPEARAKMSASHIGKKLKPEHRAKLLAFLRSPEHREKARATQLGKKASPETLAKMSASMRGRVPSPETRAKMMMSHRKTLENPEVRARLSAVKKEWWRKRKLAESLKTPKGVETAIN